MWPFLKDRTEVLVAALDRHGDKIVEAAKIRARWIEPELPPAPPPVEMKPHEIKFVVWLDTQPVETRSHYQALFDIACGKRAAEGEYTMAQSRFTLLDRGAPLP